MPVKSSAADTFGVVTVSLVALSILLGSLCILYSFYFRTRTHSRSFDYLSYFNGPWVIRIMLILFTFWWGLGEIIRLSLLRREGRPSNTFNLKWQETMCKIYIVSNLGFAEPCLFLTLACLLGAPLQKMELGTFNRKWNRKTLGYVLLYCSLVFLLQLLAILIGPKLLIKDGVRRVPRYFTRVSVLSDDVALCTYPLLSTSLYGIFVTFITMYMIWIGRRLLNTVISKCLQKRIYALVFSVSSFLPLRVVLLGLSSFTRPDHFSFEALSFCAFLALLCCACVSVCMLVYWPMADTLFVKHLLDLEAIERISNDCHDIISFLHNQSSAEQSPENILDQYSGNASIERGSISFRTMDRDELSGGALVELGPFFPCRHADTFPMLIHVP